MRRYTIYVSVCMFFPFRLLHINCFFPLSIEYMLIPMVISWEIDFTDLFLLDNGYYLKTFMFTSMYGSTTTTNEVSFRPHVNVFGIEINIDISSLQHYNDSAHVEKLRRIISLFLIYKATIEAQKKAAHELINETKESTKWKTLTEKWWCRSAILSFIRMHLLFYECQLNALNNFCYVQNFQLWHYRGKKIAYTQAQHTHTHSLRILWIEERKRKQKKAKWMSEWKNAKYHFLLNYLFNFF